MNGIHYRKGFIVGFFVFIFGYAVRNDTAARLYADLIAFPDSHSYRYAGIKRTGKVDIAQSSAVNASGAFFKLLYYFTSPYFRRPGKRSCGKYSLNGAECITILADITLDL